MKLRFSLSNSNLQVPVGSRHLCLKSSVCFKNNSRRKYIFISHEVSLQYLILILRSIYNCIFWVIAELNNLSHWLQVSILLNKQSKIICDLLIRKYFQLSRHRIHSGYKIPFTPLLHQTLGKQEDTLWGFCLQTLFTFPSWFPKLPALACLSSMKLNWSPLPKLTL